MKINPVIAAAIGRPQTTHRADNPLEKAPGSHLTDAPTVPDAESLDPATPDKEEGIRKAARNFESYFLSHMFKVMRETIPKDGLFKQSFSSDTYTGMLDQEYSRILSDGGGLGLAVMLERQLGGALSKGEALGALERQISDAQSDFSDDSV